MPYAITHFLVVVFLLELFRNHILKSKRKFSSHYVLIGGLAGILPDFDIAVYYILSFFGYTKHNIHRTFSHSIFFVLLFLFFGFLFYNFKSERLSKHRLKLRYIFFVISFGVLIHIALDSLTWGVLIFYPFSDYRLMFNIVEFFPKPWQKTLMPSLDAILLILWMIYLEIKHKFSKVL